ncbi:MAG: hypothetical protein NVS2B12_23750 [Ktedonobacteraceae bacterium]
MPYSYQNERYARSIISEFVSSQRNLVDTMPLIIENNQLADLFKNAPDQPTGPVDLLYRFTDDEQQEPALAFQQDGVENEEEMYILVYVDPRLTRSWQNQVDRYRS